MKKLALLLAFAPSIAFAAPFHGVGPVKMTTSMVKTNAVMTKLESRMGASPTNTDIAIKGDKWTATSLSTFNGTPVPGKPIERPFAEGTISGSKSKGYDVTVNPIER